MCVPIIEEVSARVQWGETEKIPRDFFKPKGGVSRYIFSSQLPFAQSLVAPAMVILSGAGAVLMGLTLYQLLLGLVSKVTGKMM